MDKVFIAYRTRAVDGATVDESAISVPGNYKDPVKIAEYVEKKKVELASTLADKVYTGTFAEVLLMLNGDKKYTLKFEETSTKGPMALRVRNIILKELPNAFPNTLNLGSKNAPEAVFIGFDIKQFIKMLGIECSLPSTSVKNNKASVALPLSMWIAPNSYRDIGEFVRPADYSDGISWPVVLQARGLLEKFPEWKGPHADVAQDLAITIEFATQLGLISENA